MISQSERLRALLFLSVATLVSTFAFQRLQLVRGQPWYTAPSFDPRSQPGDVDPECVQSLDYTGFGDLTSVICQARQSDPYSLTPPSTQTPAFLFVHRAADNFPKFFILFCLLAVLTGITIWFRSGRDRDFRVRVFVILSAISLPVMAAFERGNFFYILAPFVVISILRLTSSFARPIKAKLAPEGLTESALISSLVSMKPTMIVVLLFGLRRPSRYVLRVFVGTLALSTAINFVFGVTFYDGSGYARALLTWRSNETVFPWNLYSVHPSSIITITTRLDVDFLLPSIFFNLFALFAPLCIFTVIVRDLLRGSFERRPFRLAGSTFDSDDYEVASSLYGASVLTLLASGASYQSAVPIAILALKFTQSDASRHWRWQIGYLAALLMPSVGLHRALLPFSSLLASGVHTFLVLALWITPSLFCFKVVLSRYMAVSSHLRSCKNLRVSDGG